MTNRIALVTGGMGGLGEAISVRLHDAGYKVVVTHSPDNAGAKDWLARMKETGRDFNAYSVDVADYDSCQRGAQKIKNELGGVDILINNAGITRDMTFKKLDKVNWDAVLRTNLDSVFNICKPMCEGMVERGWGRIINISSVNGSKGSDSILLTARSTTEPLIRYSYARVGYHGGFAVSTNAAAIYAKTNKSFQIQCDALHTDSRVCSANEGCARGCYINV
jgi:NAD(P)-dependent dehydrogenase (short-subunit alcohol dehydrogenase family)